ncbi:MAG: UbiX family flavin prenyltransferase [Sedimentisphaerales bacterium]|nr:UbiX family flavin prenyltransferase [Sedimentisphaerales bacterium]
MAQSKDIVVGISGASGVLYGRRLLDVLGGTEYRVHVIVTDLGRQILLNECGVTEITAEALIGRSQSNLVFHDNQDLFKPLASGSFLSAGMAICPCSTHTLSSIAAGLADTLLLRAAYVTLKQRRPLVLVHRETPLTAIDLDNMQTITRAGGIIMPASPSFYLQPQSINDLVDTVVGRTLDLLGVRHDLPVRWMRS